MSKGTTARNIRVPDDVWQAAKQKAAGDGTTVSDVVQAFLREYAGTPKAAPPQPGDSGRGGAAVRAEVVGGTGAR